MFEIDQSGRPAECSQSEATHHTRASRARAACRRVWMPRPRHLVTRAHVPVAGRCRVTKCARQRSGDLLAVALSHTASCGFVQGGGPVASLRQGSTQSANCAEDQRRSTATMVRTRGLLDGAPFRRAGVPPTSHSRCSPDFAQLVESARSKCGRFARCNTQATVRFSQSPRRPRTVGDHPPHHAIQMELGAGDHLSH